MTEPQLELPQLSLARYFDLLKRRRWQVIPVSLLGLVVGAVVAFFVPRYYVATSTLHYLRAPGEVAQRANEDPFLNVVSNATLTIPLAVGDAMSALGWIEAAETDPYRLRQNQRAVEQRIAVVDANPGRDRLYAQLHIVYRDLDGQRAAEFLNKLVEIWKRNQIEDMRQAADKVRRRTSENLNTANTDYQRINQDLNHLARLYGFQRDLAESAQKELLRERERERAERQRRHAELVGEVARLELLLEAARGALDRTPRTKPPTELELLERMPQGSEARQLLVQMLMVEKLLKYGMTPLHPEYRATQALLARLKEQLHELQMGAAGGEFQNPRIAELQQQIESANQQLAKARSELAVIAPKVAEDEALAERRTAAEVEFFDKQRALRQALDRSLAAQAAHEAALQVLSDLEMRQPIEVVYRASIPPAPTEPNILLVAVLGSVLGLGLAIGLILLLDVVQRTFKTVDDVERDLPVPVLGGMSHLETEEQRQRAAMSRRRASLLAGAFLFLMAVLVTVYYVGPERLPPFARNLLSLVLGN